MFKLLLILVLSISIQAQDFKPIKSSLATAGIIANLRSSSDSIKAVTKTLLKEAEKTITETPGTAGAIKFESRPNKFLSEYSNKEYCTGKKNETKVKPISFKQTLPSVDAFSDYFSALALGKNDDGEKLYDECPKDCSFNFTINLVKTGNKYNADIKTLCSDARDKDDNQYLLAVYYK